VIYKRSCNQCGQLYKGWGKSYCSNKCRGIWQSQNQVGENHPSWKGGYKNSFGQCLDCNKKLKTYYAVRCIICHNKNNGKNQVGINHWNWRGGKSRLPSCIDCGKNVSAYNVKRCDSCNNQFQTKENNPSWRGGTTTLQQQIRNCEKYIELLKQSKARDDYQCLMPNCDSDSKMLHSNHVKLFSTILSENNIQSLNDAIGCEELWDEKNLITLCKPCHQHIRSREEQFQNIFRLILNKLYNYEY